jgi:hypothetical protein
MGSPIVREASTSQRVTIDVGRLARRIPLIALSYLAVTWALFIIVDVANVAGTRDALVAAGVDPPALWWHLFEEGHLTEWLQWTCLGLFATVSAALAGRASTVAQGPTTRFWVLMAAAGVLMLIEDAGNPRHTLGDFAWTLTGTVTAVLTMHAIVFGTIAAVVLVGLILLGSVPQQAATAWRLLVSGVATYALAGSLSLAGYSGLYGSLGGVLRVSLLGDRLLQFVPAGHAPHPYLFDSLLMDRLVEESLELLGASLLLAAAVAYLGHHRDDPAIGEVQEGLWTRRSLLRR